MATLMLWLNDAFHRIEVARSVVFRLVSKRFGEVPTSIESAIQSIRDSELLGRMIYRVLETKGWDCPGSA